MQSKSSLWIGLDAPIQLAARFLFLSLSLFLSFSLSLSARFFPQRLNPNPNPSLSQDRVLAQKMIFSFSS